MEKGLRDCCRSIRIGKILIKFNEESKTPMVMQLIIPRAQFVIVKLIWFDVTQLVNLC